MGAGLVVIGLTGGISCGKSSISKILTVGSLAYFFTQV
jgi:dephospho-CoA kinase